MRPPDALDHLVIRIDGLTGVAPVTPEDVVLEKAGADVMVVDVGDLELTATRRLELRDHVEDVRLVAIETGDGEASRRVRRFLDDFCDPPALEARHSEVAQLLGFAYTAEQVSGRLGLPLELVD